MNTCVFCISRPTLNLDSVFAFLREHSLTWRRTPRATAAEELIELCGRICYMSFGPDQSPRTTREYIANLISSGHDSVLEHATWTFILTGVSRALSHQLVRHRVGFSFSQLSQQYHDEREASFVAPPEILGSQRASEAWRRHVQTSLKTYKEILEVLDNDYEAGSSIPAKERRRSIRSAARSVLPNATETKLAVTANARAIRHFLKIRGSIAGDIEMRKVSVALLEMVQKDAPAVFADFVVEELSDGTSQVVLQSLPSSSCSPLKKSDDRRALNGSRGQPAAS